MLALLLALHHCPCSGDGALLPSGVGAAGGGALLPSGVGAAGGGAHLTSGVGAAGGGTPCLVTRRAKTADDFINIT